MKMGIFDGHLLTIHYFSCGGELMPSISSRVARKRTLPGVTTLEFVNTRHEMRSSGYFVPSNDWYQQNMRI